MLKLFITNIIKNMLIDDVKNEFKAELFNFLKTNKWGIIAHLSMIFTISFTLLMSLYELITFGAGYFVTGMYEHTHLLTSGTLALLSLLLSAKVFSYIGKAKLEINRRVKEVRKQKLAPLTVFEPILNALKEERIRYQINKHNEQHQLAH